MEKKTKEKGPAYEGGRTDLRKWTARKMDGYKKKRNKTKVFFFLLKKYTLNQWRCQCRFVFLLLFFGF